LGRSLRLTGSQPTDGRTQENATTDSYHATIAAAVFCCALRLVLHITAIGATHGLLRLMSQMVRQWQIHHGVHLDLILRFGELGFFPDPNWIDSTTRRLSLVDPEDLSHFRYFAAPVPAEKHPALERLLCGPEDDLDTVLCP